MRKLYILSFVVFLFHASHAASLNLLLQKKIDKAENKSALYPLFVKGNSAAIKAYTLQHKGLVKMQRNDISSIELPILLIRDFAEKSFVQRIEDAAIPVKFLMDTSLINNNILPVHNGQTPLTKAYTGKDVVMGIIDGGVDWRHGDFKLPNGTSRIKYLWDQNNTTPTNTPLPYTYGQEWKASDFTAGTAAYMEPNSSAGHGTNVCGIAAGNANQNGKFKGVAPNSEMIVVGIDYNNPFLTHVVDGVDYIFKKADAMGLPAVVNTSLGTYWGSHDGKDLATELIENLLEERTGRAVVAAAGNAGNIPHHLSYPISSDTAFTWFEYLASDNGVYMEFWADTAQFKNASFGFGADSASGSFSNVVIPRWISMPTIFQTLRQQGSYTTVLNFTARNGAYIGQATVQIERIDSRLNGQIQINPNTTSLLWSFNTTGAGTFDVWGHPSVTGSAGMKYVGLPDSTTYPKMKLYKSPDLRKTTVSSWQCSDKVLTVANYNNRAGFFDIDSVWQSSLLEAGAIFPTSSAGPTRDNRVKPDISASGNFTIASINLNSRASLLISGRNKLAQGGYHSRNGGTSMASPVVAGSVALYLEKNPNAGYREINEVIRRTARQDTFTTAVLPNPTWGFGKLNLFAAMNYPVIMGCMDTGSINYNAAANIDNGTCIPKVYGCKDSTALNYNPLANVSNGTCIPKIYGCMDSTAKNYNPLANIKNDSCDYSSSIKTTYLNGLSCKNIDHATLEVSSENLIIHGEIVLRNITGAILLNTSFNGNSKILSLSNYSSGVYILQVLNEEKQILLTTKVSKW